MVIGMIEIFVNDVVMVFDRQTKWCVWYITGIDHYWICNMDDWIIK